MAGIYLHIPFCKRRCIYCDFYSTTHNELRKSYIDALCKEFELRKDYLITVSNTQEKNVSAKSLPIIHTIYLGGGTPSQLNTNELRFIFDRLYQVFQIAPDAEITLEANPDDLTVEKINELRSLPINRISIGIQTFNNRILSLLQRRHNSEQACKAILLCQEAGFKNISIDLIYGLPGQSLDEWKKDIEQALALCPTHISAYSLTYEEGTLIWNMRKKNLVKETGEELSLQMFTCLMEKLAHAGFEHYEISNFSLPEFHSRHNSSYWNNEKYLGCGPSAHSYNGINRQWNMAHLERYIATIHALWEGKDPIYPLFEVEHPDLNARYNDRIITSIRTRQGLDLYLLQQDFGIDLYQYCMQMATPHVLRKKLTHTPCTKEFPYGKLILSRTGIFVSDDIMSDLLCVED